MIQPQIPTLDIQPLNKEVFAPFGTVIETDGAKQISINQGTTTRFDAMSAVDAAIGAMSEKGGMIHLHGLAASGEYNHYSTNWISEIQAASNDYDVRPATIHRIKSYAPRWDHVVLDVILIPHHDYE